MVHLELLVVCVLAVCCLLYHSLPGVTGLRANKQLSFAEWKNGRCYRVHNPWVCPRRCNKPLNEWDMAKT